MVKFAKYGTAPVSAYSPFFFISPEKEKEFNEAPESVRKMAMALLEATVKQSMRELNNEMVLQKLQELDERMYKLEKRENG